MALCIMNGTNVYVNTFGSENIVWENCFSSMGKCDQRITGSYLTQNGNTFAIVPASPAYVFGEKIVRPGLNLLNRVGDLVNGLFNQMFIFFPGAVAQKIPDHSMLEPNNFCKYSKNYLDKADLSDLSAYEEKIIRTNDIFGNLILNITNAEVLLPTLRRGSKRCNLLAHANEKMLDLLNSLEVKELSPQSPWYSMEKVCLLASATRVASPKLFIMNNQKWTLIPITELAEPECTKPLEDAKKAIDDARDVLDQVDRGCPDELVISTEQLELLFNNEQLEHVLNFTTKLINQLKIENNIHDTALSIEKLYHDIEVNIDNIYQELKSIEVKFEDLTQTPDRLVTSWKVVNDGFRTAGFSFELIEHGSCISEPGPVEPTILPVVGIGVLSVLLLLALIKHSCKMQNFDRTFVLAEMDTEQSEEESEDGSQAVIPEEDENLLFRAAREPSPDRPPVRRRIQNRQ